jgi:hypothetical protein
MKPLQLRRAIGSAAVLAAILAAGTLIGSHRGQAFDRDSDSEEAKIRRGLAIAPVPLNMHGKNSDLVGLGSYIVNAQASCNDCHSASPQTEFSDGGNPYFSQHPTVMNPATYLGGGRDFGAFPDPNGPFPHIISRNLTPVHGLPAGDLTLEKFTQILKTGIDFDNAHPTCSGAPNGTCLPAPFDGTRLQIMPWPILQNMTDRDIAAIYEYLSAIPCLEGGPGEPANRCK